MAVRTINYLQLSPIPEGVWSPEGELVFPDKSKKPEGMERRAKTVKHASAKAKAKFEKSTQKRRTKA